MDSDDDVDNGDSLYCYDDDDLDGIAGKANREAQSLTPGREADSGRLSNGYSGRTSGIAARHSS